MFRKLIWIATIIAIIVGAIALYLLFEKPALETQNIEITAEQVELDKKIEEISQRGTGTIKELMERGENLECTILYVSNDLSEELTEGTMFASRDRLRGDFVVPETEAGSVSSVIVRNEIMYSWSEIQGEQYGMKIDLKKLADYKKQPSDATLDTREVVPLDAKVKYICKTWNDIDGSIFEPPTDIIFKDFNEIVNTGMEFGNIFEGGPVDNVSQCSLCEQVAAGEGRDSCLLNFGCE
jgi:hypothetical protein